MTQLDHEEIEALDEEFDADSHDARADLGEQKSEANAITHWDYQRLESRAKVETDRLVQALREICEIAQTFKGGEPRLDIYKAMGKISGISEFHGLMMRVELK